MFSPSDQKSNRSSNQPTGSFSIDSFLPSWSRYLYARISLPSFVPINLTNIANVSTGFVAHLITADAFDNAEPGTFANICVIDG